MEISKYCMDYRFNEDKIYVAVIADAHIGETTKEQVSKYVDTLGKLPNLYYMIGGDLLNNAIPNSKSSVIEEVDGLHGFDQVKCAVDIFKPYKDRILSVYTGNHEWRSKTNAFISPTEVFASLAEVPEKYKDTMAILYLSIGDNTYSIFGSHKARKTEVRDWVNTDVVVTEHLHLGTYEKVQYIYHNLYTKKASFRDRFILRCPSLVEYPTYSQFAGYRPQTSGCFIIELQGGRASNRHITIHRYEDLVLNLNLK